MKFYAKETRREKSGGEIENDMFSIAGIRKG